jgi:hypothetical protein
VRRGAPLDEVIKLTTDLQAALRSKADLEKELEDCKNQLMTLEHALKVRHISKGLHAPSCPV